MKYFLLLLMLIGCDNRTDAQIQAEEARSIVYVKDSRTNLCFVETHSYGGYRQFANVPCSPEVERLINK